MALCCIAGGLNHKNEGLRDFNPFAGARISFEAHYVECPFFVAHGAVVARDAAVARDAVVARDVVMVRDAAMDPDAKNPLNLVFEFVT